MRRWRSWRANTAMRSLNEFGLIERFFAPLAHGFPGSYGLTDDAASISPPPGCELVITKDAMCAGVHFFGDEDASLIAKKLLRVNLSDLAAKGARPMCYFLALMLPEDTSLPWLESFAAGLAEEQAHTHIHLAGGDTTATHGPLCMSVTMVGSVANGQMLRRSSARAGDRVYVSGTLGDSALGLAVLQKRLLVDSAASLWLKERYFLPQPRLALGQALHGIARASMDISDGLVQDAGHICKASGVGMILHRHKLPLSRSALDVLLEQPHWWDAVTSGGDDYEILFTVPHSLEEELVEAARSLVLPLTCIGDVVAGEGVKMFDEHGADVTPVTGGYRHF